MIKTKLKAPEFEKMISRFSIRLKTELTRAQNESGKKLKEAVKNAFEFGRPEWPALSPKYREWKASVGYSTDIMKRSLLMYHTVTWGKTDNYGGEVGFPSGATYPKALEFRQYSAKEGRRKRKSGGSRSGIDSIPAVMVKHEKNAPKKRAVFAPVKRENEKIIQEYFEKALSRALGVK